MRILFLFAIFAAQLFASTEAAAQCRNDMDCRGIRVCEGGVCMNPKCTMDVECPNNGICQENQCVPAQIRPAPPAKPKRRVRRSRRRRQRRGRPQATVPDGEYRVTRRPINGLWVPGIIIFAVTYGATIVVTTAADDDFVGFAAIPLAGPFILAATERSNNIEDLRAVAILSGVLQVAGLAMTVLGLSIKRTRYVPIYSLGKTEEAPALAVLPGPVGPSGVGLNLSLLNF